VLFVYIDINTKNIKTMSYSTLSLYEVIEERLVEDLTHPSSFWECKYGRPDIIISYIKDKDHIVFDYNNELETECPEYKTDFGGMIVDVSMLIELDLKISIKPLKKHWEVCEEIATLFLKNNMSSLDKFFYNEIKNGLLD
jgi:hypothetical protein